MRKTQIQFERLQLQGAEAGVKVLAPFNFPNKTMAAEENAVGAKETPTAAPQPELVTGYLYKQGRVIKSWKRRFIVLVGQEMQYFKNEAAYKGGQKAKGKMWLDGATVVLKSSAYSGKSRSFEVCGLDRNLLMYADTEEEFQQWVMQIQMACISATKSTVDLINKRVQSLDFAVSESEEEGELDHTAVTKSDSMLSISDERGTVQRNSHSGSARSISSANESVQQSPDHTIHDAYLTDVPVANLNKPLDSETKDGQQQQLPDAAVASQEDVALEAQKKQGDEAATNQVERVSNFRQKRASVVIQQAFRGKRARTQMAKAAKQRAALSLQRLYRGGKSRELVANVRAEKQRQEAAAAEAQQRAAEAARQTEEEQRRSALEAWEREQQKFRSVLETGGVLMKKTGAEAEYRVPRYVWVEFTEDPRVCWSKGRHKVADCKSELLSKFSAVTTDAPPARKKKRFSMVAANLHDSHSERVRLISKEACFSLLHCKGPLHNIDLHLDKAASTSRREGHVALRRKPWVEAFEWAIGQYGHRNVAESKS